MLAKNDYLFMTSKQKFYRNLTYWEAREFAFKIFKHTGLRPFIFRWSPADNEFLPCMMDVCYDGKGHEV